MPRELTPIQQKLKDAFMSLNEVEELTDKAILKEDIQEIKSKILLLRYMHDELA